MPASSRHPLRVGWLAAAGAAALQGGREGGGWWMSAGGRSGLQGFQHSRGNAQRARQGCAGRCARFTPPHRPADSPAMPATGGAAAGLCSGVPSPGALPGRPQSLPAENTPTAAVLRSQASHQSRLCKDAHQASSARARAHAVALRILRGDACTAGSVEHKEEIQWVSFAPMQGVSSSSSDFAQTHLSTADTAGGGGMLPSL